MTTNQLLRGSLMLFVFLFSSGLQAQQIVGTVKDDTGELLTGASILITKSSKGTFADIDGTYKLSIDAGEHQVTCSFIGYNSITRTVSVGAGETVTVDFTLEQDSYSIDDVVVVGYGVQRKRDVTGSIAKIDAEQLTAIPTPSFEAALQGRAAGVQVSQGSGIAGSGSLIRVRGIASVSAGGDPLYVVDGIPITQDYFLRGNSGALNNNPLTSINPSDIASIEILKDASATGIYGSRGANGVILITTKRGKNKGLGVDFSARTGVSTPSARPNMLNTEEYLAIRQEAWENDGGTGYVWLEGLTNAQDDAETRQAAYQDALGTNTDWVDETIGIGVKQSYNVGLSYGMNKVKLYGGLGYENNGSFLVGNKYERVSARLNADITINNWFKIMANSSYARGDNHRVDAAWSGGLGQGMSTALTYFPVRWEEDVWQVQGGDSTLIHEAGDWFTDRSNPVANREARVWRTIEDRSISNLSLIFTPIRDLNIKLAGSYDYMDLKEDRFDSPDLSNTSAIGTASRKPTWVNNYSYTATANYTWELDDQSRFNFLAGHEYQRSKTEYYDNINYQNVNGAPFQGSDVQTDSTNVVKGAFGRNLWSFISYFGRVNYFLQDKYIFQGTARVDGSSRFGRNYRYGFFPSLSAGWIISEEDFLIDNETINFMKLKASWGITGNADIPGNARWGIYQTSGITYDGEGILFPTQLENKDLRWERSRTIDVSVEVGLWEDKIHFEIGVYDKFSKDVLMNVNVSPSTGFTNWWDNVAQVRNRGIELSVTSRNIDKPDFSWTTEFNIARNYNELEDIGNYTPDAVSGGTNDSRVIVGKPIGSFYLMEFSHVDPENGLPVYLDANGNETYDYDNSQRKYVGDGLPDVIGGLNNTFRWKNWDLGVFMTYSLGAKIFDSSAKRQLGVVTDWNMRTEILDRWRQPGDVDVTFPRMTLDATTYGMDDGWYWWNTSLFVYDASYLRVKNLVLGYNFDNLKISKLEFSQFRVAFNVTNAFTLTNFPGLDPEVVRDFENAQDRNMSPNVTYLTPPQERSYNLSLNFSF